MYDVYHKIMGPKSKKEIKEVFSEEIEGIFTEETVQEKKKVSVKGPVTKMGKRMEHRIFIFLERVKISDSEFAKSIGVSRQHVSKWRTGATRPASRTIVKILSVYNELNLNWLVNGVGNMMIEANYQRGEQIMDQYDKGLDVMMNEMQLHRDQAHINIRIIKMLEEERKLINEYIKEYLGLSIDEVIVLKKHASHQSAKKLA